MNQGEFGNEYNVVLAFDVGVPDGFSTILQLGRYSGSTIADVYRNYQLFGKVTTTSLLFLLDSDDL